MKEYLSFDSVIDIGCGAGQILMACRDSGVEIIRGVDGSWVNTELLLIPAECFTRHDLSQPGLKDKIPEQHFDLVMEERLNDYPALASHAGMKVLDIVHPEIYTIRVERLKDATDISSMNFRRLCKIILSAVFHLAPAFIRAVKKRLHAW